MSESELSAYGANRADIELHQILFCIAPRSRNETYRPCTWIHASLCFSSFIQRDLAVLNHEGEGVQGR